MLLRELWRSLGNDTCISWVFLDCFINTLRMIFAVLPFFTIAGMMILWSILSGTVHELVKGHKSELCKVAP